MGSSVATNCQLLAILATFRSDVLAFFRAKTNKLQHSVLMYISVPFIMHCSNGSCVGYGGLYVNRCTVLWCIWMNLVSCCSVSFVGLVWMCAVGTHTYTVQYANPCMLGRLVQNHYLYKVQYSKRGSVRVLMHIFKYSGAHSTCKDHV